MSYIKAWSQKLINFRYILGCIYDISTKIYTVYIYICLYVCTCIHVFASQDGSICLSPTFHGPFECEENISTEKMYVGAMPPHWAVTNETIGGPPKGNGAVYTL